MAYDGGSSPVTRQPTITMQLVIWAAPGRDRIMAVSDAPEIKLLTVPQVAVMLSLSESQVWIMVSRGELESVKIGWSRRIMAASVDEYIRGLPR